MNLQEHPTVKQYRAGTQDRPIPGPKLNRQWLIDLCRQWGADDAGLAEIDDPRLASQKEDILAAFPQTRTLVSFVRRLNPANIRCSNRAVSDNEFLHAFQEIDRTAHKVAAVLAEQGVRVLTPSAGFPMDMRRWPGKIWDVSHKSVAEVAGLGKMGLHRLLIHPVFGAYVVLGTLLLDREADGYDRPLDFDPCLDCKLCVAACPVGAIKGDGTMHFANCLTHNYRDRLGGFQNWTEQVVRSRSVKDYRNRIPDRETVSVWQSLTYGVCNKSSYCMAVCPAGLDNVGPFLEDRKKYLAEVVTPLQESPEPVFVVPDSDAEAHVRKRFPRKWIRRVSNGLRPDSVQGFIRSMDLVFQPGQSKGLDAAFHFSFTGNETLEVTVVIKDQKLQVLEGLQGKPDLTLTADAQTWVRFLAKEKNILWALATRKIRIKGSPKLMGAFAKCFPG